MTGNRFEILFVCHANLCRSPLAEQLARRAFDDAFGTAATQVVTSSAGTHAYPGTPMHAGSAHVLEEWGIESNGFASRTVNESILAGADLVLTAAREQRAACVTMAPATIRRTFTMRQFARFMVAVSPSACTGTPAQRMGALLEQVAAVRHRVAPVPAEADDLPDPVGLPIEAFRVCANEIGQTMRLLTGVITAS